jgi:hypothetical protein
MKAFNGKSSKEECSASTMVLAVDQGLPQGTNFSLEG